MEKTMTFTDNGKKYTLTFTRATLIETENMGFNITDIATKPIGTLLTLWRGAFLANHESLTDEEKDAIFERIDKNGLLDALLVLYRAPLDSLFDEEDSSKNSIKWTVT